MQIYEGEIRVRDRHVESVPSFSQDHVRRGISVTSVDNNLGSRISSLNCSHCAPKNTLAPTASVAVGVEERHRDAFAVLTGFYFGRLELDYEEDGKGGEVDEEGEEKAEVHEGIGETP